MVPKRSPPPCTLGGAGAELTGAPHQGGGFESLRPGAVASAMKWGLGTCSPGQSHLMAQAENLLCEVKLETQRPAEISGGTSLPGAHSSASWAQVQHQGGG